MSTVWDFFKANGSLLFLALVLVSYSKQQGGSYATEKNRVATAFVTIIV